MDDFVEEALTGYKCHGIKLLYFVLGAWLNCLKCHFPRENVYV